jgi:hypothetical protein
MPTIHLWIWDTTCCNWEMKNATVVPYPPAWREATVCYWLHVEVMTDMMAWLQGYLEVVDSLTEPSSRAAQWAGACRVWTPDESQKEASVTIYENCQLLKSANRGMLTTGPGRGEYTALRREQLDNSSARPNLQGTKTEKRPKWKHKYHSQCGTVVPFMRAARDVMGRPPLEHNKQQYAWRLLGTSSLKEGAMQHAT